MILTSRAARTDLTDRECCRIIGGLLGSLIQLSPKHELRNAVRWWAENDEAWELLEYSLNEVRAMDEGKD